MSDFQNNYSVIGAGVMGLTTAWFLQQQGYQVTVYEQAQAFSGSSWAGGGIISPVPPWNYPLAVRQLIAQSLSDYPSLLADLQRASGIDSEFVQTGLLYCGPFDAASEQWRSKCADSVEPGSLSDWLPSAPDMPVWWFRHAAQLRNPKFGQALTRAVMARGVKVYPQATVKRLLVKTNRVKGLLLDSGQRIHTEQVVLAAGAWCDNILANSGLPLLGVKPIRGQMLLWKGKPGMLSHILSGYGKYLIPRKDGYILGGSTVEDVGFDLANTDAAHAEIIAGCRKMYPAIDDLPLVRQWSGLRPGIDREIPVIGPMPGLAGLWINAGHYRNGLGMAPASAQLLVDLITGSDSSFAHENYAMQPMSLARSIA